MTANITSSHSDTVIGGPADLPPGSRRRLRDRAFAITWGISVAGATFGWLYALERVVSYSMNWLY